MEWIRLTVNRALRRQTLDLSRFTEGTLRVAFDRVPEEWNHSQVAELQTTFDDMLAGSGLRSESTTWWAILLRTAAPASPCAPSSGVSESAAGRATEPPRAGTLGWC